MAVKRNLDVLTKKELLQKLKVLDLKDDDQKRKVVCSLIGHSNIQSSCFGYYYCGRCNAQVGDQLGGIYDATEIVIIGHNCEKCQENYKKMTWHDKFMVQDPLVKERG